MARPIRREHVDDLGQERREHRQELSDVDPRAARQLLDGVGSERLTERLRGDRLVRAGRHPRIDRPPSPPARSLSMMPSIPPAPWIAWPRPPSAARIPLPLAPAWFSMFEMSSIVRTLRCHPVPGRGWSPIVRDAFGGRLAGRRVAVGRLRPGRAASSPRSAAARSSRRPVRSSWIGVTAMRRLTTAWKSVPSTARPDGGGPPIQK